MAPGVTTGDVSASPKSSTTKHENETFKKSSSVALFTEQSIPGKGKGLVATHAITPGTRILTESPLFTTASLTSLETQEKDLAKIIKGLPREGQRAFLSLHNNNPGREPLSNIVRTNAYPLGPSSSVGAIFPTIARINHSCRPNTQHAWNEALGVETVHVVRAISPGDELTLSYSAGGTSDVRRKNLKQYFGFDCTCEICSLPATELAVSDARLARAAQLDEAIGNPKRVMMTPEKALADCRALLELYAQEGIADTRIPRAYYDAFQICVMHADAARARVFAQRSREARVLCEGEDGTEVGEMAALVENPAGHENYGATSKWKTGVDKVPKNMGKEAFEKWLWRI